MYVPSAMALWKPKTGDRFEHLRSEMVRIQCEARGIRDPRVLKRLREVPRHRFVPEKRLFEAYEDKPVALPSGQTISQPYIVAWMTEALLLEGKERVLEVGTGSGYQTAILSGLCRKVWSIEVRRELHEAAKARLQGMGLENVELRHGNGRLGWPEAAPFDRILVTAAPDEVPVNLTDQLAEGGRLVLPVGSFFQKLFILTRQGKEIRREEGIRVRFVPLTD